MWEYRLDSEISLDSLNYLGSEGWECFWVYQETPKSPMDFYSKRSLLEGSINQGEAGEFVVKKNYTYGEITQVYVLGAIFFVLLFYVLKKIFTHEQVDIVNFKKRTGNKI